MRNSTTQHMVEKKINFFLSAVFVHALFFSFMWSGQHGRGHIVKNAESDHSALSVNLIAESHGKFDSSGNGTKSANVDDVKKSFAPESDAARVTTPESKQESELATSDLSNFPQLAAYELATTLFPDYVPSSRLNVKPSPTTPIDLNKVAVGTSDFRGAVELTVLIDANGNVDDVLASIDNDKARDFINRVASVFRAAHFTAGQLDGKTVKSQIKIHVVSEHAPAS
jgi:hypothetical protein